MGGTRLTVRPVRASDDPAVRELFAQTVGLGRPLPFPVAAFEHYQALCLDWYLGPGRADAAVAVDGAHVWGYALVCTHPKEFERWLRSRALLFLVRTAWPALSRGESGRFLRLRVADAWQSRRHRFAPPMAAHAHLNLAAGQRAGVTGRLLVDHIDQRCRLAHLPGWFGEMNAPVGRRARALERLGARVVHRAPNHTLSWLCGQPVERLTVVRHIDDRRDDPHESVALSA
jgi:hypothetical protein